MVKFKKRFKVSNYVFGFTFYPANGLGFFFRDCRGYDRAFGYVAGVLGFSIVVYKVALNG